MSKASLQKLLVGHFIEELPKEFNKKIGYVWDGEGIWEIRKLALGTFTNNIHKFKTPGLCSNLKEGWDLNVPKIPASMLDITLSFFRQIYTKHSSEVFLQYFYDVDKKEYVLHCPQQSVGPGSVNYKRDADYEKGKILVFEIHSHGSMGAFFSGTDDGDEKDDRFFGVIGNVKNYYPDIKLRLSVGGRRKEIEIEDIFNLDDSSYHVQSFPKEWVDKIKEKKVIKNHKINRKQTRSGAIYYPADDFQNDFYDLEMYCRYRDEHYGLGKKELPEKQINKPEKFIEKDGKSFKVIDTGTEEIWEEVENGDKDDNEDGIFQEWDWRNVRW